MTLIREITHGLDIIGNVAGDAPRLIERQRLGDCSIALISVAVDIGDGLPVRVYDLEPAGNSSQRSMVVGSGALSANDFQKNP